MNPKSSIVTKFFSELIKARLLYKEVVKIKAVLASIAELPRERIKAMLPMERLLIYDIVKSHEYYAEKIKKTLDGYLIGAERTEQYKMDYLHGFDQGHIADELEGIVLGDVPLPEYNKSRILSIYDIGGGLGYWAQVLRDSLFFDHECITHIVEKDDVVGYVNEFQDRPGFEGEKAVVLKSSEWFSLEDKSLSSNSLIVMGSFLHLFDRDDAIRMLVKTIEKVEQLKHVSGLNCCIFIIEPIDGPSFSFRMIEQMLIMKGVKSCYQHLTSVIHEAGYNSIDAIMALTEYYSVWSLFIDQKSISDWSEAHSKSGRKAH